MTWWMLLSGALALLLILMALGVPLFAAFLVMNVTGVLVLFGPAGFGLFANSIYTTATTSVLAAVPLFIAMGEIMFRSGTMEVLFELVGSIGRPISRAPIRRLYPAIGNPWCSFRRSHGSCRPARAFSFSCYAGPWIRYPVLGRNRVGGREPRSDNPA